VRRRLWLFFSALSLLLCVATIKLWLRSYGTQDQFWWGRVTQGPEGQDDVSLYMGCDRGGLYIARWGSRFPQDLLKAHPNNLRPAGPYRGRRSRDSSGIYPYQGRRTGAPVAFRVAGFEVTTGLRPSPRDPFRRHTLALVVPLWAVTLLTALASMPFLVRLLRRHTPPTGAQPCPHCGYDLRATPDRCPECGRPAPNPVPLKTPGLAN
jgi:hypothetical protein